MAQLLRRYSEDRLAWAHTDLFKAGLDPFSFLIYSYFAARADSHGKAWPKQSTIAADCNVSERQVRNCIEKLVKARLLVVLEQSGPTGGRRSIYYLATRNEWLSEQLQKGDEPAADAALQVANRQDLPVQPAADAGSLYKGTKSIELNPSIAAQAPSPPSVSAVSKPTKAKAPKHIDPKKFLVEYPDEFRQDDAFCEAFLGWANDRIAKKNPLTERAAAIARKKLIVYPVKIAIDACDRAVLAGWSGVFPESVGKGGAADKFKEASGNKSNQNHGF